jgi:predicted metal-binding membrane protein
MNRVTRLTIVATVAGLTLLSWLYLVRLSTQMEALSAHDGSMEDMGMPVTAPWSMAEGAVAFGMWAMMMIGMMSPSALPVLFVVAKSEGARGGNALRTTAWFAAGYLAVWMVFSLAAAGVQWLLHEVAWPASTAVASGFGGVILIGAGLYQQTPLKRACLLHCRNPIDVLMSHWHPGLAGAFRMGLHHGWFCLGCCWALMAVLFGVGIMNLVWVGAIAVFVLLEKLGVGGVWLTRVAGGFLIAIGAMWLIRLSGLG